MPTSPPLPDPGQARHERHLLRPEDRMPVEGSSTIPRGAEHSPRPFPRVAQGWCLPTPMLSSPSPTAQPDFSDRLLIEQMTILMLSFSTAQKLSARDV
jgi:hypothetical protein